MGEYASSYNSLVDAHNDQSEEVAWLKAKVTDLEHRSHRNNVKLRGIPESDHGISYQSKPLRDHCPPPRCPPRMIGMLCHTSGKLKSTAPEPLRSNQISNLHNFCTNMELAAHKFPLLEKWAVFLPQIPDGIYLFTIFVTC